MPATPQDRLFGLTTSVAVKPAVYISADYNVTRYGEQTITSSTPTGDRTVTTTEGMRILLLGQTNAVENGIWEARRAAWVRAPDFNGPRDVVNGTLVFNITGDCWQVEADDPVIIGTSEINFRTTYPFEANLDIFQRTLRVPEASVSLLPQISGRKNSLLGFNSSGNPVPVFTVTETGDLALQLASNESGLGLGLIGTIYGYTAQQMLSQVTPIDNIAALRTTEPAFSGAKARVTSYHSNWSSDGVGPIGGGDFYHDATDTTTADDGIFTFVTAGGARWKRQLNGVTLNLAMGGVRNGDDATTVLTAMVANILARFTAQTAPTPTGTSPVYVGSIVDYKNTVIEVYPGNYVLSSTVQLYTVVSLKALGVVVWDGRTVTTGAAIFKISNDGLGVAYTPVYFRNGPVLNGAGGPHNILGSKTVPGISIGNTADGYVNCRDWMCHNVGVRYTTSMIEFTGSHDTYLCHFSQMLGYGFTDNAINFLRVTSSNSGERMSFQEITVGGCDGTIIYASQPGLMLSFDQGSFDLCNGNVLSIGSNGTNLTIDFKNCHAEGFDLFLINNQYTTTNRITWDGGQVLPTSRTRGALDNYMGRNIFSGILQGVQMVNSTVYNSYPADGASVYLGAPSDTTNNRPLRMSGVNTSLGSVGSIFDIANRGYDFSAETIGATFSSSVTSLTRFQKPADVTTWINGVSGTIIDVGDGTKALQIVPATTGLTSNFINITTVDYLPVLGGRSKLALWLVGQILTTTIRYRVSLSVKWYDSDKNLISTTSAGGLSDLYTNSQVTTLPSYSSDATTNGNRKLATYVNTNNAPSGSVYARPVWVISGIDQTINVNALGCALVD